MEVITQTSDGIIAIQKTQSVDSRASWTPFSCVHDSVVPRLYIRIKRLNRVRTSIADFAVAATEIRTELRHVSWNVLRMYYVACNTVEN